MSEGKIVVRAAHAPVSNRYPYSPGMVVGDQIYVSGQGPINLSTGKIEGATLEEQVELTIRNVESILKAADSGLEDVVKVTAYLLHIEDFDRYNVVYQRMFPEPRPARTTVEANLWSGILIEIDAVAIRGCGKKGA